MSGLRNFLDSIGQTPNRVPKAHKWQIEAFSENLISPFKVQLKTELRICFSLDIEVEQTNPLTHQSSNFPPRLGASFDLGTIQLKQFDL